MFPWMVISMLDLLIILCRCPSYERTHMVLFSSVLLLRSDMSVEFQQLWAALNVFRTACAVQLCCEARNYSPAIAPCACSASRPLRILQTAKVPHSERLLQKFAQLRLSALARLETRRSGAAHVILLGAFGCAPELHSGRAVRSSRAQCCLQLRAEQIQPAVKSSRFKTCRFQCI